MAMRFSLILSQLLALIKQPPAAATYQAYPRLRNFILDVMTEGRRKHTINLLFDADIHAARTLLAQYETQYGERISMTTYLAKSLACALNEDKSMQAYRLGKSKLVTFDDIDLAIMVEREIDDATMPVTLIVRAANQKPISVIQHELRAAKSTPLGENGLMSALEKQFFELPQVLRKFIWFFIRRDPYLFKQLAGTVGITSMGMHVSGPAVVIPITPMTLTLSIGAIHTRLILEDGHPVEREYIQMNLGVDHDIIDGAPLMRFADRFKQILLSGDALEPHSADA